MKRQTTGLIALGLAALGLLIAFRILGGLPTATEGHGSAPQAGAADGSSPGASVLSAAPPGAPSGAAVKRYVIVPGESTATYRVNETFFREGNRLNTAVGVTPAVQGEIRIDTADPRQSTIGPITVDISQFKSDSSRRDNAIRERWLESARFPTAQFTTTAIRGLPARYVDGEELRLQIAGNLKVRDVTRAVTFEAAVKVAGSTLNATAAAMVRMTDFGFEPPSIFGILRAENEVAIELNIVAREAR